MSDEEDANLLKTQGLPRTTERRAVSRMFESDEDIEPIVSSSDTCRSRALGPHQPRPRAPRFGAQRSSLAILR